MIAYTRWWFQIVFMFIPTWGNAPIWPIFFKCVETTNQYICILYCIASQIFRLGTCVPKNGVKFSNFWVFLFGKVDGRMSCRPSPSCCQTRNLRVPAQQKRREKMEITTPRNITAGTWFHHLFWNWNSSEPKPPFSRFHVSFQGWPLKIKWLELKVMKVCFGWFPFSNRWFLSESNRPFSVKPPCFLGSASSSWTFLRFKATFADHSDGRAVISFEDLELLRWDVEGFEVDIFNNTVGSTLQGTDTYPTLGSSENHLQKWLLIGYVSSQEGIYSQFDFDYHYVMQYVFDHIVYVEYPSTHLPHKIWLWHPNCTTTWCVKKILFT